MEPALSAMQRLSEMKRGRYASRALKLCRVITHRGGFE
jgi:hypothetical protein